MKTAFYGYLLLLIVLLIPSFISAEELIAKADALYAKRAYDTCKESLNLYRQILEKDPNHYEANWKCARSCWDYGNLANKDKIEGWKNICETYGEKGMGYAQKAIDIHPDRVEGYFYYGCCASTYADGCGIINIVRKGIVKKIQRNLEKAYGIDKTFDSGGPIQALGQFWFVVPWPLQDRKKAETYLRESMVLFPDDAAGMYILAELLLKTNREDEARNLLTKTANSKNIIYRNKAAAKLKELE